MQIHIIGYRELQDLSPEKPYALVSISDRVEENSLLKSHRNNPYCNGILRLGFHDYLTRAEAEQEGKTLFESSMAFALLDFVKQQSRNAELLVFQCHAGISRSSACAAASLVFLKQEDRFVFRDKKYFPHLDCYEIILRQFLSPAEIAGLLEERREIIRLKARNLSLKDLT